MRKLHPSLRERAKIEFLSLVRKIEKTTFYLLILFLPTQLGRHFWPPFSNVLGIRIDYLSPTLYVTDILIVVLFVFSFGRLLNWLKSKFIIYYLLFIIFVTAGIVLSKSPMVGFYGLLKILELTFLGIYISRNLQRESFNNILLLLSVGVIFESLLTIFQFLNRGSLNGVFYFLGERFFNSQTPGIANVVLNGELVLRPYGTFPHPNVLAGYITIAMTIVISNINPSASLRARNQISKTWKLFYYSVITIGTTALLLSLSRIAIALWVLILGFFLVRKFIIHKSYILILLVGLLMLGVAAPLGLRLSNLSIRDESIVQREKLAQSSLLMIKNSPILGVGLNNFLINLPNYQKANSSLFYLQPVHNLFLLIMAETGVAGLGFFIWLLINVYRRIVNHESRIMNGGIGTIHYSSFIILSSVLILGMFDHYFLTLQQGQLLFAFVFGLCWSRKLSF